MNNIKREIIQFINDNRMSTEEVSDAMGKKGVVRGAKPICTGQYCVGELEYVYAYDNSNWPIHEQISELKGDRILFVDDINVTEMALFGQLVSRYIIQKQKELAIVTTGYMRDLQGMKEDNVLMWCKGIIPIGCFNKQVSPSEYVLETAKRNKDFYDGSIAVCDDSGVVVVPKELITNNFLDKLKMLHEQEKIWFDCIMNRNWNTYDTVCLKKYLEEEQ